MSTYLLIEVPDDRLQTPKVLAARETLEGMGNVVDDLLQSQVVAEQRQRALEHGLRVRVYEPADLEVEAPHVVYARPTYSE